MRGKGILTILLEDTLEGARRRRRKILKLIDEVKVEGCIRAKKNVETTVTNGTCKPAKERVMTFRQKQ